MTDSTEKSPHSPLRLFAIALMSAVAFSAVMVPLHRVLHAPAQISQHAQAVEQKTRAAESSQRAHVWQAAQSFEIENSTPLTSAAHSHADQSPLGHTAGKDCDNWNAVFGADSLATQPLGVIGPDAALSQKISPPRDAAYARLSASPYPARAPPRC